MIGRDGVRDVEYGVIELVAELSAHLLRQRHGDKPPVLAGGLEEPITMPPTTATR